MLKTDNVMKINCIIIDDEPLARKGLKEYVNDVEFLHLAGEFDTCLAAADSLNKDSLQLILLDIQMPHISGLDFLKSLANPPAAIITTAYPQYALEGFELNVLDYLVKPIAFNRFLKAAMKAKDYYEARENANAMQHKNVSEDHVFIKADGRLIKILYGDILFVEALQNYVAINTQNKKYITYLTFKSLEENLPANHFLKVHKSFIVQTSKVTGIDGNQIMINDHSIPVSRNLKEEVMQKLLGNKFLRR